MKSLSIEVSESITEAIRIPEAEQADRLPLELALSLYAQNLLSLGKAAELAKKDRHTFSQELGRRKIPRHYTEVELKEDLQYARGQ